MGKKIYLKSYGCKVNQYEAQVMQERFVKKGFDLTSHVEAADYMVVNTCTVTEGSDKELEYLIRKTKRQNPQIKILLSGCYVNHHRDKLTEDSEITGLIRDDHKHLVPELIEEFEKDTSADFPHEIRSIQNDYYGITEFSGRTRAFVKVQDGCNKRCSFCIITVVRGASRSREISDIEKEVEHLANAGYQEVVLTGVQIGMFGRDKGLRNGLVELIQKISLIAGIERIRLSSIDPLYVSQYLLDEMVKNDKLVPQLHISLQSGDDTILRKMRRGHDASYFRDLIHKFQENVQDFAWTTDVITGFPGETEACFQNTFDLLQTLTPIKIHAFPYSDRTNTEASVFDEKVESAIKKKRVHQLLELEKACFQKVAAPYVGVRRVGLIEQVKTSSGHFYITGRLPNYIPFRIFSETFVNKGLVDVEISDVTDGAVVASLLK